MVANGAEWACVTRRRKRAAIEAFQFLTPRRSGALAAAFVNPSCKSPTASTFGENHAMRYAIYYTPAPDDPLTRLAARWLGRDPFTGETTSPPSSAALSPAEFAFHTAAPRRYGFHATLKAPFRLEPSETEAALLRHLDQFVRELRPVVLPSLTLGQIDGFFALMPEERSPALDDLAAEVVLAFDRFRAPMSEAELGRRNPEQLSPSELKNLHRWGYPYVFDDFRFHMTLTGRARGPEATKLRRAIEAHFGPVLEEPVEIDALGLFVEPEPGAPFKVLSFHQRAAEPERKLA
jgi:putative phosphonate metabolism protein